MLTLCAQHERDQRQLPRATCRRRLSRAVWAQCGNVFQLVAQRAARADIERALLVLSELTGRPRYERPKP
jgi:hypothetical protein